MGEPRPVVRSGTSRVVTTGTWRTVVVAEAPRPALVASAAFVPLPEVYAVIVGDRMWPLCPSDRGDQYVEVGYDGGAKVINLGFRNGGIQGNEPTEFVWPLGVDWKFPVVDQGKDGSDFSGSRITSFALTQFRGPVGRMCLSAEMMVNGVKGGGREEELTPTAHIDLSSIVVTVDDERTTGHHKEPQLIYDLVAYAPNLKFVRPLRVRP